jgi:hypothetical protein
MKQKAVKKHPRNKSPAETADAGGSAYAPHDREAERLAEKTNKQARPSNAGEERTPEKTIGEIKYAEKK